MLKTLEFIFRNEEVCCQFNKSPSIGNLYNDFSDGKYYKHYPLYSKSKNASCFFITFPRCKKKYGIDKILRPFVEYVKVLEQTGINVSFTEQPLYGTTAEVTGDNLDLNSILGYVESFTANYYCRICLIDKASAQTAFSDDDPRVILRTKTTNDEHYSYLENPRESYFGIKRNSILNSLSYFSVSENYVLDIMHDILEGVAQYEIKLLFEYLNQKSISIENILQHVYAFNYGFMNKKSPNAH